MSYILRSGGAFHCCLSRAARSYWGEAQCTPSSMHSKLNISALMQRFF